MEKEKDELIKDMNLTFPVTNGWWCMACQMFHPYGMYCTPASFYWDEKEKVLKESFDRKLLYYQ